jgi:kynurenine formamidase
MPGELPDYDDLPVLDGAPPLRASWGVWGDHDVFGSLNQLTPEGVVAAARLVQTGRVFALNWSMRRPDPPLFGRASFTHEVTGSATATSHDDVLHGWNTQSSSQWDGFRHVRNHQFGHYGGVPDDEHGIDHWARRGIVGRAVLADVGRWREAQGRPLRYRSADAFTVDDVRACLAAQGTVAQPGDVLLMRTGWVGWYESLSVDERAALAAVGDFAAPGLMPGEDTARGLWNLHIAAIGCDNPAVEVWPPGSQATAELTAEVRADRNRMHEIFVHTLLLPMLGIPLGELWDLEALAADCAADGRYECLFTSAPLNLPSGVASPPNALAIK